MLEDLKQVAANVKLYIIYPEAHYHNFGSQNSNLQKQSDKWNHLTHRTGMNSFWQTE